MSDRAPWGKRPDPLDSSRLIEDPEEQEIANRIVQMRSQGMRLREIARRLELDGVPRRGKPHWHHEIVRAILKRRRAGYQSVSWAPAQL